MDNLNVTTYTDSLDCAITTLVAMSKRVPLRSTVFVKLSPNPEYRTLIVEARLRGVHVSAEMRAAYDTETTMRPTILPLGRLCAIVRDARKVARSGQVRIIGNGVCGATVYWTHLETNWQAGGSATIRPSHTAPDYNYFDRMPLKPVATWRLVAVSQDTLRMLAELPYYSEDGICLTTPKLGDVGAALQATSYHRGVHFEAFGLAKLL